jgi:mono/diheme cytochrome c family protein
LIARKDGVCARRRIVATKHLPVPLQRTASLWLLGAALAACSGIEIDHTRAAREVARAAEPPGQLHTGWRVYEARCAGCHGADATGSGRAPDLLVSVRTMGPRRFADEVLRRYDWNLPPLPDDSARESRIDAPLRRREDAQSMPDWQGDLRVTSHIEDLYAYLSARAQGTQGPGRPPP